VNWQPPIHRSLIGASHRRKGVVCQDYSLSASLRSRSGVPIKLMAVSDGHGGARYWRSDVGSRLACEIAIKEARKALGRGLLNWSAPSSSNLLKWQQWQKQALPEKLIETWRLAVADDWQRFEKPAERQAEAFSVYSYGCTLGLVVMTPHWWCCTGLGDWDLVRVGWNSHSNANKAELINREENVGLQGESTFSLCKNDALQHFAERSTTESINRGQSPFALLLSTDGVRKSCAADTDFLTLAHYLVSKASIKRDGGECHELDEDLDRITTEGSGDDVSVAIGINGPLKLEDTGA